MHPFKELNSLISELVSVCHPVKVILFGSYAKGIPGPDSDLDLLVIEDEPFGSVRSRRKEMARLSRHLAHFGVPQDILVYTPREIALWKDSINHIVHKALKEGKVLYERGKPS